MLRDPIYQRDPEDLLDRETHNTPMRPMRPMRPNTTNQYFTRVFFGNSECPGSDDAKMNLWLVYFCLGGSDRTTHNKPNCVKVV